MEIGDIHPDDWADLLKKINEAGLNLNFIARPTKDEYYLSIAKNVLSRSTCLKRQYGAVIVNNDEIVSTGYNGAPRGERNCSDVGYCKRLNINHNSGSYGDCFAVHAEQNAMLSASRKEMLGSTLYLYGMENGKIINAKPCPICARMIKNAGIENVINNEGSIDIECLL